MQRDEEVGWWQKWLSWVVAFNGGSTNRPSSLSIRPAPFPPRRTSDSQPLLLDFVYHDTAAPYMPYRIGLYRRYFCFASPVLLAIQLQRSCMTLDCPAEDDDLCFEETGRPASSAKPLPIVTNSRQLTHRDLQQPPSQRAS